MIRGSIFVCAAALSVAGAFAGTEGDAIAAALASAPPTPRMSDAREEALKALDTWIARPDSEHMPEVIAYYQAAVDRALETLELERVKSGVRVFQLYSSSYIVQAPETTFAIDLDQGPNGNLTKTPEEEGETFCLRPEQVARLAKLVDYSFHTHEHDDHVDYAIVRALLEVGKTVIVTESNKEMWANQPWGDKLVVLEQTVKRPLEVGPLKVDVLWDHQWNNEAHTSGTPCNAFIVTTPGGATVMTKGDINCGLQWLGWLSLIEARGQKIDVAVGSPIFWRGVPTLGEVNALVDPLWLPGHAWEFNHRDRDEPKGHCLGYAQSYTLTKGTGRTDNVQVLTWGEWMDIAD